MLVVITKGELTKIGLSKLRETTEDLGGTCVHLILRLCTLVYVVRICSCACIHFILHLWTWFVFAHLFLCLCTCALVCICPKRLRTLPLVTLPLSSNPFVWKFVWKSISKKGCAFMPFETYNQTLCHGGGHWSFLSTQFWKSYTYDTVSDVVNMWMQWRSDFQSGSRVLERVWWPFSYARLLWLCRCCDYLMITNGRQLFGWQSDNQVICFQCNYHLIVNRTLQI